MIKILKDEPQKDDPFALKKGDADSVAAAAALDNVPIDPSKIDDMPANYVPGPNIQNPQSIIMGPQV